MSYALLAKPRGQVDPIERLDLLDKALIDPDAMKIAPALPLEMSASGEPDAPVQARFARAQIDRLGRLGYLAPAEAAALRARLPDDDEAAGEAREIVRDTVFRDAVRAFQGEADLQVDGWVGPETWTAMQAYFSFEGPRAQLGRRQRRARRDDLARLRAALLRLDVLGFVAERRGQAHLDSLSRMELAASGVRAARNDRASLLAALREPLARLKAFLQDMQVWSPRLDSAAMRALVLDYDALSALMARVDVDRLSGKVLKRNRPFIRRFLTVEMWLIDTEAGGAEPLELPQTGRKSQRFSRTRIEISRVLCDLKDAERDLPRDQREVTALLKPFRDRRRYRKAAHGVVADNAELLFPIVFRAVAVMLQRSADHETVNADLVDALDEEPGFLERLWENARRLGSRLWDGVRRVVGWVRSLFRRAADYLVKLTRSVVRVVAAFSVEALNAVRDALRVVRKGLEHLLEPVSHGPRRAMAYARDTDFDAVVLVDAERTEAVRDDARYFVARSQAFGLALALINALFQACLRFAKLFATGWIGIGVALLDISRKAREAARWLGEMRDLNETFAALEQKPA